MILKIKQSWVLTKMAVVKARRMYGCCIWGFIVLAPPICTACMLLGVP